MCDPTTTQGGSLFLIPDKMQRCYATCFLLISLGAFITIHFARRYNISGPDKAQVSFHVWLTIPSIIMITQAFLTPSGWAPCPTLIDRGGAMTRASRTAAPRWQLSAVAGDMTPGKPSICRVRPQTWRCRPPYDSEAVARSYETPFILPPPL